MVATEVGNAVPLPTVSTKIETRFATGSLAGLQNCTVPGCSRKSSLAIGTGRSAYYCRYHVQRKSRHGSHWHDTYPANELKPYLTAAKGWLDACRRASDVLATIAEMDRRLATAGRAEPAMNLRGLNAATRARIAFARLSDAEIPAKRLVAIYLAVAALIEDDFGSHRTRDFQIVQAAKAAHRLASGTHRRWAMWNPKGEDVPIEIHAYPRSSGLVLRKIGEAMGKVVDPLVGAAVPEIIRLKVERFGPHPSHHAAAE
ncbi:hypothetical protein C8D77_103407 [Mesorhizobium loti]|uniref:Uncharacterized protein n=2 Tax=Rhizobium loti TaxID=381 RepID=A0A8E2WFK7_RHILI|nr:hypothetical protein C8D77_103407 [Mesorhizobium loti]